MLLASEASAQMLAAVAPPAKLVSGVHTARRVTNKNCDNRRDWGTQRGPRLAQVLPHTGLFFIRGLWCFKVVHVGDSNTTLAQRK
jgi:hypothetical protein